MTVEDYAALGQFLRSTGFLNLEAALTFIRENADTPEGAAVEKALATAFKLKDDA
jgi:hypothetical protein